MQEEILDGSVELIKAKSLGDICHGFLGRKGGVSTGIYAGLNISLGSADDPQAILENRRRAAQAVLPDAKLCRVYQIHSADVVTVNAPLNLDNPPQADAMVTDRPNILLGISTADCVPVLFADKKAGIIGAAHSGWKGAIGGVNDATIAAMENLGANRANISCAIGPCIAKKSYEVDDSFFQNFAETNAEYERFFGAGKPGHYQFDIEAFVAFRLAAAGIGKIECLGQDTYSQPDRFYSYRRSCHLNEAGYGTQMSLIGLRK